MSIIRTEHNKTNPYVILNKSALEDKNLSWAAKGLWSYLMSRPDNWKVSIAHLTTIYDDRGGGEKAIYSLLNELIEKGYCERKQDRGQKGQFVKYEYIITELKNKVPHRPQADAAEADAVPPDADKGDTNKEGVLTSNDCLSKKETTTKVAVDLIFTDQQKEQLNNFTPEQIKHALDVTQRDCIQNANHSRVKFFFKVLTTSPEKKSKLSVYEELKQHFVHGKEYNHALCDLILEGIGFTRGMKQGQIALDKYFSWEKFQNLCEDFGIKFQRK